MYQKRKSSSHLYKILEHTEAASKAPRPHRRLPHTVSWVVSTGKALVELKSALQVRSLLSSQSLEGEEVVQAGTGMKTTVGEPSLSFYGCGLKMETEDYNPLHRHLPAANRGDDRANLSLDTLWPCGSSYSPFAPGPCKDFCMLFSKHLFSDSDLSNVAYGAFP